MSMMQRLGQMEKKMAGMTGKAGEHGQVIIIRTFGHASDAVLVGYRAQVEDHSYTLICMPMGTKPHQVGSY